MVRCIKDCCEMVKAKSRENILNTRPAGHGPFGWTISAFVNNCLANLSSAITHAQLQAMIKGCSERYCANCF